MTGSEPAGADLGTLIRGDGEVTIRYARRLAHPAEKVWRALTEAEHLAAWFPTTIEGELVAGVRLRFAFREVAIDAMDGTVLAVDPPKLLEYTWGDERLRFELTPNGTGTELVFTASFADLGKAARDGAGWHVCLDLLGYALAGQDAPWSSDDRWRQVIDGYRAGFGPDASVEGPPPEWEDAYGPAEGSGAAGQ
jgi:uncharacterized protein YndB with AHSA1/START domain